MTTISHQQTGHAPDFLTSASPLRLAGDIPVETFTAETQRAPRWRRGFLADVFGGFQRRWQWLGWQRHNLSRTLARLRHAWGENCQACCQGGDRQDPEGHAASAARAPGVDGRIHEANIFLGFKN